MSENMIKQDYKSRDRRQVPTSNPHDMMEFTYKAHQVSKLVLIICIIALASALLIREARAQTPQDGYDGLNMSPQGLYWSNPAQGYGEPAGSRYRPYGAPGAGSGSTWGGFQPGQPPTYYNEHGQPSTVPDPRQYYDVEGVQM